MFCYMLMLTKIYIMCLTVTAFNVNAVYMNLSDDDMFILVLSSEEKCRLCADFKREGASFLLA